MLNVYFTTNNLVHLYQVMGPYLTTVVLFMILHNLERINAAGINVTQVTNADEHYDYEDQSPFLKKITWLPKRTLDINEVEPAGLISLHSGIFPQELFVARAKYRDGVIPGYWNPSLEMMFIGNPENEEIVIPADKVRLLYSPKGSTSWVGATKDQHFSNGFSLVVGGQLPGSRVILHVCRAMVSGSSLVVGYKMEGDNKCVVSFG